LHTFLHRVDRPCRRATLGPADSGVVFPSARSVQPPQRLRCCAGLWACAASRSADATALRGGGPLRLVRRGAVASRGDDWPEPKRARNVARAAGTFAGHRPPRSERRAGGLVPMTNGWTGGQYSLFRIAFGIYLSVHFAQLAPWAVELFSNRGALPHAADSPL